MVAAVGSGVVLGGDDLITPDRPDGAQLQIVEVHHQVRRQASDLPVVLFRDADRYWDGVVLVVPQVLELRAKLAANRAELGRRDRSVRLSTGDVQEDPAVVAALGPRRRAFPIDESMVER